MIKGSFKTSSGSIFEVEQLRDSTIYIEKLKQSPDSWISFRDRKELMEFINELLELFPQRIEVDES